MSFSPTNHKVDIKRVPSAYAELVVWLKDTASALSGNSFLEKNLATSPKVIARTGAPTETQPKGTLCLRVDGTSATILYVNTDGAGTWVAVAAAGNDFGATGIKTDVVQESTAGVGVTIKTANRTIGASTAAAGADSAGAGVLPAGTAPVYPTTAADDTKGVRIHANDKVTGRMLFIGNGVSNKILKVYAPTGGAINGAAADAAFSSVSGKGVQILCLDSAGNTWLAW